ncbi:unnamed protein product [Trichobilharzia regenti]|nr:unnamed protein product [Trichobilharzia regenti]
MTKSSFSNSTRRHTLQFATSLFHKPSHHRDNADSIMTANNGDDDDDGDDNGVADDDKAGGSLQPVQPNTTSVTTSDTTSPQGVLDGAANKLHEQSDVDNKNKNPNQGNASTTEGNSTKRSTVRRFPRQITQPHPNRLQYNQNNAENSDQMLRVSLFSMEIIIIIMICFNTKTVLVIQNGNFSINHNIASNFFKL